MSHVKIPVPNVSFYNSSVWDSGSTNLPSGYTTAANHGIILGYGASGMRFTWLGKIENVNIMVSVSGGAVGYISVNTQTGTITNNASVSITITEIFAVTEN